MGGLLTVGMNKVHQFGLCGGWVGSPNLALIDSPSFSQCFDVCCCPVNSTFQSSLVSVQGPRPALNPLENDPDPSSGLLCQQNQYEAQMWDMSQSAP